MGPLRKPVHRHPRAGNTGRPCPRQCDHRFFCDYVVPLSRLTLGSDPAKKCWRDVETGAQKVHVLEMFITPSAPVSTTGNRNTIAPRASPSVMEAEPGEDEHRRQYERRKGIGPPLQLRHKPGLSSRTADYAGQCNKGQFTHALGGRSRDAVQRLSAAMSASTQTVSDLSRLFGNTRSHKGM